MYLIDTDIISELRKGGSANPGVHAFFNNVAVQGIACYLSVITVGELSRGVEMIRHRGDSKQADALSSWLMTTLDEYGNYILDVDCDVATLWGHLRVPHHENALDKLIAATALVYSLKLVTRNTKHYEKTGVKIVNPFSSTK